MAQRLVPFLSGITLGLGIWLAHTIITHAFYHQVKLSCHHLKPTITQTEYCVYHTKKPSLLGTHYQLLIGPSASRGIVYGIPYDHSAVRVDWTDDIAHITMPGTMLTIAPSQYVDSR